VSNNYKIPKWKREKEYNEAVDAYLGREEFKFDVNEDALYNQLKDVYASQAKLAAEDATARASALTGGYGNSYAATAGSQAYSTHMEGLNEAIPSLYSAAVDRYTAEGDRQLGNISLLMSDYNKYLGELPKVSEEPMVSEGTNDPGASFDEDLYNTHLDENNGRSYAEQFIADFDTFVKNGYTKDDVIPMIDELYANSYITPSEYGQLIDYANNYYYRIKRRG
jgi:hypothetical protein